MECYWQAGRTNADQTTAATSTRSTTTPNPFADSDSDGETNDMDVDERYEQRRQRMLLRQDGEDWETEFNSYMKDMARDVTRDTDLVQWWSVCNFSLISLSVWLTSLYSLSDQWPSFPYPLAHRTRRTTCASVVCYVRTHVLLWKAYRARPSLSVGTG